MKLELKNLSAYLPYDLKVLVHGDFEMTMTYKRHIKPYDVESISLEGVLEDGYVKPILRPLSDLFQDTETFNFIDVSKTLKVQQLIDYIESGLIESVFLYVLLEKHYDVFGLINAKLAVDINTLKK